MARPEEVAGTVPSLSYRLSMPEPHTQLFHVELRVEGVTGEVDLVMPAWTPGSYLMREFARNVREISTTDGAGSRIGWRKAEKSRWRVEAPADGVVIAHYTVHAHELTVRTSHLDATHGYVNGASVFLYTEEARDEPLTLEVEPPDGWRCATSLEEEAPNRFRAASYDELVDSPMEIGTHQLLEWDLDGIPHRYAIWGRGSYDPQRLVEDTRAIVRAHRELWGPLPYRDYTFILHLVPGGYGGLEHRASCSLQADRWSFKGKEYEQLLGLVAHEFFHVWNATRIRPAPLERVDYTSESYTRNLWVIEGLTTYYTDLVLRRAGIITPERYLERLGEAIGRLRNLPGRHVQSVADSSFDTWIRFYRPDQTTPSSQVSYYQKGALVGLLLDMEIRSGTENRRSLDDVMLLLWERYGAVDVGFPEETAEGMRALAEEVAGRDLGEFFDAYVFGTDELPLERALSVAGVRIAEGRREKPGKGLAGAAAAPTRMPAPIPAGELELGLRLKEEHGRTVVTHVLAGTPAYRAGVNAGDELVALDGLRVQSAGLPARVAERKLGDQVLLTVFRRDELVVLEISLDRVASGTPRLVQVDGASEAQRAVYGSWLRGVSDGAGGAAGGEAGRVDGRSGAD